MSHTNIDEQVHLALRWSIGETTENQSLSTAKIWNDTNKVGFFIMLFVINQCTFFILL
jgi:hypothetical protein